MYKLLNVFVSRMGDPAAVNASAIPVLSGDVLRVLNSPRGAAVRRHALHTPHTHGSTAGGKYCS